MAEDTNVKFCMRMQVRDTKPKNEILGPPIISGTAEYTNLKFCMRIEGKG